MGSEYYERLGVASDASTAEIAAAYRERLKETHPDVSDASDAGERTKRLIEAKEVLTDETERARYDRLGHDRYVTIEQGRTPDQAASASGDHQTSEGREASRTGDAAGASKRESATSTAHGDSETRQQRAGARGTRGPGGVDWGTHTARRGRSRHTDSTDRVAWAETDWKTVSEAVWQEVTGDEASGSGHATAGWGADSRSDNSSADASATGTEEESGDSRTTGDGTHRTGATQGATTGAATQGDKTGGSTTSPTAEETGADTATAGAAGPGANGGGATASTTAASAAGRTARPGGADSAAGPADGGDWSVGWYTGGDPSGTSHDAYSYSGSDSTGDLWDSWSPGPDHGGRYRRSSLAPHPVLSPIQTVVLFCLCFVTYPLLVTGTVFPLFNSPTRLLFAMVLVLVVAVLIIMSQLGVVVFGGWTVLFPVVFANYGVSVFAPAGLLTVTTVLVSLGLAVLSYLLVRQPGV